MRKLMMALMVVGVLALAAAPAMAQGTGGVGAGDPLGLITSGAVLPYFAGSTSAADLSFIEVQTPVNGLARAFHMFFYDENCNRVGPSVGLQLTNNDTELLTINTIQNIPARGLIAAAIVDETGFNLNPLPAGSPVHTRVMWFNTSTGFGRVLEPIAVTNLDTRFTQSWNPLRTGATFYAPPEVGQVHTTLYFICPNENIAGKAAATAFPESRFPALIPAAQKANTATPLRFRIYDDEELFLRDVTSTCNCLTVKPVNAIDPVYSDLSVVTGIGTYTEVEGGTQATAPTGPFAFTGYRNIRIGGNFSPEVFGRLSNAWKCDLIDQGGANTDCTLAQPNQR